MAEVVPNDFECPVCMEIYSERDRCPMSLYPCGHSVCGECLSHINRCPKCTAFFQGSSVAYAVMGSLEQYLELKAINEARERSAAQHANELQRLQLELAKAQSVTDEENRRIDENRRMNIENQIAQMLNQQQHSSHEKELEELQVQLAQLRSREDLLMNEALQNMDLKNAMAESTAAQLGRTKNWKSVFIRGLPAEKTEDQFIHMCRAISDDFTENFNIKMYYPPTKGMCLITFECDESARKFLEIYNKKRFMNTENIMKIEFGEFSAQKEKSEASPQPSQANAPTIDKTKLFIIGLPLHISEDDVHRWIFEFNPNIQSGKSGISLREIGGKKSCLATFTNEDEPNKIITKWNNKLYPGSDHVLHVQHHRPKNHNKTQKNDKQNSQIQTSPNASEEVELFILGLPPKVTETDVVVIIFRNSKFLLTHSISLRVAGSVQCCRVKVTKRSFAMLVITEWAGKRYPGSNNIIKIDFFKPSTRPRDPSMGREPQQFRARDQTPRLTSSLTSSIGGIPPRQTARRIEQTYQRPPILPRQALAPTSISVNARSQYSPSPRSQQQHKVLISGLPIETQLDDIVTTFHPICKICLDAELNPRIEMYRDTSGHFSGMAMIAFQTSDAAQKIVHLFNNVHFGNTNKIINVQLYN